MEYHPSGHGPVYCGMPPPFLPRHPRFWHADGNLQIHLGNMEYRLHRYLFNKARSFPTLWGAPLEPLYLSESKIDFDRFLSVLYPLDYSEEECKTAEEWASVLRLADKWSMQDVRRLAINRLESCAGPVDKIALGHRYNVPNWLGPAYLALAMRKEPVTSAEGLKMGVEALVRIAALKDDVFANLTEYVDQNKFAELFASKLAM
ncbi:hypothetical protein C8R44DRAFT_618953 [Mycena epipterygia]|nr:hypothetical protein C8R44DRAFT_618953 [Mycena epipterygia]